MYIKIFGKKKKCQSSEGIKHSLKHFVKKLGNYPVSPASPFSISKSYNRESNCQERNQKAENNMIHVHCNN